MIAIVAGLAIWSGGWAGVFIPPESASFTEVTVATAGNQWQSLAMLLSILFTLNIILFSFNLIPLLPLDGSAAVTLIMSERTAAVYRQVMFNPMLSMFGLL